MTNRYKSLSAIFPIIIKHENGREQILLHRRQNTGYEDGMWDMAGSGHVDEGETAKEATIRECKEEIGISIEIENLSFAHLSHRILYDRSYYDIYFIVNSYSGNPTIMEPEKSSELEWFPMDKLPTDIIEYRRQDIAHYLSNVHYSEKTENRSQR